MANRDSIVQIFKNKYGRTKSYCNIRSQSQKSSCDCLPKITLTHWLERKLAAISGLDKKLVSICHFINSNPLYIRLTNILSGMNKLIVQEVNYV
ncbi:hypothetical protein GCM10009131_04190 [Morganella psychrotolerans]